MSFACVVTAAAMLALLGQTSYAACGDYANCSFCASDGNCMWALLYDCTERCINRNYDNPKDIKNEGAIWRSTVRDETQCPNKEWCEIMEGDVPNPSFESWTWKEFSEEEKKKYLGEDGKPIVTGITEHSPWVFARIVAVKNQTAAPKVNGKDITCVDGEFLLYMGGSQGEKKIQTYEVKLYDSLKISEGATHLSFFYALPCYSRHFDKDYEFIDRTALDVYIDNEHLLHMYNGNINKTFYRESDALYHPMNIDISRFADGKSHFLMFYFTEGKDPEMYKDGPMSPGTPGQIMLIDYIQIIKSNLNGSTFDGWKGAPFDRKTSCSEYCRPEYVGDGVCDLICMTKECDHDGSDCDFKTSLSTDAIVGIALGVTCGVIIIGLIVLALILFKRNRSSAKTVEMGMTKKSHHKKGWSVSTKNIMFGGKEAEIGIALKDTMTVTNTGKPRTFSVGLVDEARCNSDMKFKVVIKPKEFHLEKNEEIAVSVSVKIFCTTTISERIEVRTDDSSEDDGEVVNLVASGKKSTRINPYDLVIGNVIGEGSFGVVYRGIYKNAFDVAIKKLKVVEEDTIESFNKEADILEKVNSENTVKFYGALVTEDYYCFVTEFAPYGSLSTLIPKIIPGDPNGGKRILCALNIAKALKYLHENKTLHRDLKPENVLVSNKVLSPVPDCVVCKLTDFGTSKILHSREEGNMTKVVGTPSYMAPEVISTNNYGKESDIYSLGASFVELWTGTQPFSDSDLQFYTFIRKIASGELVNTEVVVLINRCLSREPENRPPIDEVISVLSNTWMSLCSGIKDFNLFP